MKMVSKLTALVISMIMLTSCTNGDDSSGRLLYIQALGIDKADSGEISCTTQVFDPILGASTIQEQSEAITKVVQTNGSSITQAVFNISEQIGKKPYYTQNKVIVIGEHLAEAGIKPYMDYFDRDWETRLTMPVVIGSPNADEIVSASLGGVINPAQELALAARSGNINGNIPKCTLLDVKKALANDYEGFCLPIVKIEGEDKDSHAVIERIAIFDGDKPCGYMTTDQARGIMYINSEIESCLEVVNVKDLGKVSLEITSANSDVKSKVENGKIVCRVKVKCDAAITEISFNGENTNLSNRLDEIETALERHIISMMQEASSLTLQLGCDVFSLNQQLRRDKNAWAVLSRDWDNNLKNTEMFFEADVNLNRIGETAG